MGFDSRCTPANRNNTNLHPHTTTWFPFLVIDDHRNGSQVSATGRSAVVGPSGVFSSMPCRPWACTYCAGLCIPTPLQSISGPGQKGGHTCRSRAARPGFGTLERSVHIASSKICSLLQPMHNIIYCVLVSRASCGTATRRAQLLGISHPLEAQTHIPRILIQDGPQRTRHYRHYRHYHAKLL